MLRVLGCVCVCVRACAPVWLLQAIHAFGRLLPCEIWAVRTLFSSFDNQCAFPAPWQATQLVLPQKLKRLLSFSMALRGHPAIARLAVGEGANAGGGSRGWGSWGASGSGSGSGSGAVVGRALSMLRSAAGVRLEDAYFYQHVLTTASLPATLWLLYPRLERISVDLGAPDADAPSTGLPLDSASIRDDMIYYLSDGLVGLVVVGAGMTGGRRGWWY